MTPAVVHYPRFGKAPDAIYWLEGEDDIKVLEAEISVSACMAAMSMFMKVPTSSWTEFFVHLAGRNPDIDWWELHELAPGCDPASVLVELRSEPGPTPR